MTSVYIPNSLERCDDAVDTAKSFLQKINSAKAITTDHLSWLKARVRSLQLFDIDFTDEEAAFFDDCLNKLADLVK